MKGNPPKNKKNALQVVVFLWGGDFDFINQGEKIL